MSGLFNHTDKVKRALVISFLVSFLSLVIKSGAFLLTDSTTAFSDAAESVVHVMAVAFVLFGYYLSRKPADDEHLYGHERIEYLSIGIEGSVIILAAITILAVSVQNLLTGFDLQHLEQGIFLIAIAGVINLALGLYILRIGRLEKNMLAISNGKHVLTDVWTSGGVLFTLLAIYLTGWIYLDIIVSLLIAGYISTEGYRLVKYSINGIMDAKNPEIHKSLLKVLEQQLPEIAKNWHNLRHRTSGRTTWIELHLTFEENISLKTAHDAATKLERHMIDAIDTDAVVTIHLEPKDPHSEIHGILKGANKARRFDDFI